MGSVSDEEDDAFFDEIEEERGAAVGYRPQKEYSFNKHLPYADALDDEAEAYLARVKANLSRAILMSELRPGILTYCLRFQKYLKLYGWKFPKDDHVLFIKLLYQILIIPDLEYGIQLKVAQVLNLLLRRTDLLTRADLELDWWPLYRLFEADFYTPYDKDKMILRPRALRPTLKSLIRKCSPYFSVNATEEMLAEWRPMLCPFDAAMNNSIEYLSTFLTVHLPPEDHERGFKLWFEELLNFYSSCSNRIAWEPHLLHLLGRLAEHNIGNVDWEIHYSLFFTKLLHSFELPISYQGLRASLGCAMDLNAMVNIIVSCLGGPKSCQSHIDILFDALDSFYNPVNTGRWAKHLADFLYILVHGFIRRLHKERYRKPTWDWQVPEENRLSDLDIERFVKCVLPASILLTGSPRYLKAAAEILQMLAFARPDMVIPRILEKTYQALETLTEPHRLTSAMHCLACVARPMACGSRYGKRGEPCFDEGPEHILPILMQSLPGIDPNDNRKTFVTLELISIFSQLILFVDCSSAPDHYDDLTEREQALCLETASVEDFVLQFLDRCFHFIESSSSLSDANTQRVDTGDPQSFFMSNEEQCAEQALNSVCSVILTQTSPAIFDSALMKLQGHVLGRTMETKVSGKYAASIVRGALKADSKKTLKAFVPIIVRTIKSLTENSDFMTDEIGDSELLFNLLLLSELVRCPESDAIVPYVEDLCSVVDRCLLMKSREGYSLVATIAAGVVRTLISFGPVEYRSTPFSLDEPVSKRLYIRYWGMGTNGRDLNVKWNIPTDEHAQLAEKVLERFLKPLLDEMLSFAKKETFMEREDLEQRLTIVEEILLEALVALPAWTDEEPIHTVESCVDIMPMPTISYPKNYRFIHFKGGVNVRAYILGVMHELVERLIGSPEEEAHTLSLVASIFAHVSADFGVPRGTQNVRMKQWLMLKRVQEDKLGRAGRHVRTTMITRIALQHDERCLSRAPWPLTQRHKMMYQDLLKMSTSRYDMVRINGQEVLMNALRAYPSSYVFIFDEVLEMLAMDPSEHHDLFKGVLYLMCGKPGSLAIKQDWEVLMKVWPALLKAKSSEKPSIVALVDRCARLIQEGLEFFNIRHEVSSEVRKAAEVLWTAVRPGQANPADFAAVPSVEDIAKGAVALKEKGDANERNYLQLVGTVGELLLGTGDTQLHWRKCAMAMVMLSSTLRPAVQMPLPAVRAVLSHLTNDHLLIRKHAIYVTCCVLRQQKRPHLFVDIDPVTMEAKSAPKLRPPRGVPRPALSPASAMRPATVGDRADNAWLQYDPSRWCDTREKHETAPYVHKTYYGWSCWPPVMEVHAPFASQPPLNRPAAEMADEERVIFEYFMDEKRVEQIMDFFCLEENKGHDKFDSRRFTLFKYLFRNFGSGVADMFRPYLEKLAVDRQESKQRVAAEMTAALARGCKHWGFDETAALRGYLVPVIARGLSSVIPETAGDWSVCFSACLQDKDPNRYFWILEALFDNPLKNDGSFVEASRGLALQSAISQQEWRIGELNKRMMDYFLAHLSHPFQSVRDRVSSIVASLLIMDIPLRGYVNTRNATRQMLYSRVSESLRPLMALVTSHSNGADDSRKSGGANHIGGDVDVLVDTVCRDVEVMDCDEAGGEPEKCGNPSDKLVDGVVAAVAAAASPAGATVSSASSGRAEKDELEVAKRLLDSITRIILGCVNRAFSASPTEFHELLPLLAQMENQDHEVDLKKMCKGCMNSLSRALILPDQIPSLLEHLGKTLSSDSWRARASGMSFLQVFCFQSMFMVRLKNDWLETVYGFVHAGLKDPRIEVRQRAAEVLGGLLHCRILTEKEQASLKEDFLSRVQSLSRRGGKRIRSTQIAKKDMTSSEMDDNRRRLVELHSVVLGLCAFVNAYPYEVPEFMPEFLMILGDHLHDPEPIPTTIKTTLSNFKRTHLDNWQEHKQKFSEDQLVVLTDLLVSPSYYA